MVYADLDGWLRDLLASEDEPSAEEVASPDWKDIALRRQESRKAFMKARSPRMGPVKDDRGVLRMIGDMGDEGLKCVFPPQVPYIRKQAEVKFQYDRYTPTRSGWEYSQTMVDPFHRSS